MRRTPLLAARAATTDRPHSQRTNQCSTASAWRAISAVSALRKPDHAAPHVAPDNGQFHCRRADVLFARSRRGRWRAQSRASCTGKRPGRPGWGAPPTVAWMCRHCCRRRGLHWPGASAAQAATQSLPPSLAPPSRSHSSSGPPRKSRRQPRPAHRRSLVRGGCPTRPRAAGGRARTGACSRPPRFTRWPTKEVQPRSVGTSKVRSLFPFTGPIVVPYSLPPSGADGSEYCKLVRGVFDLGEHSGPSTAIGKGDPSVGGRSWELWVYSLPTNPDPVQCVRVHVGGPVTEQTRRPTATDHTQ